MVDREPPAEEGHEQPRAAGESGETGRGRAEAAVLDAATLVEDWVIEGHGGALALHFRPVLVESEGLETRSWTPG